MRRPTARWLLPLKWNRCSRVAAVLCGGSLAAAIPGCLLPVAPTGGRLLIDALLDVLLGWIP